MYNPYGNVADAYQLQQQPQQLQQQRRVPQLKQYIPPQPQQHLQHPQPHHPTQFSQPQPMGIPPHQDSPHMHQHPQPQPMHQQQQQQQQSQQPGFNFFNDPATALASQFARSGFEHSNQYLQENFGSFAAFSGVDIKYYFQVSNSYVFRKILLILFPYRHKDWNRISTKGTGQSQYLPPSHDINAPDLYIPLMSFVTYILLWAAFEGLKEISILNYLDI